MSPETLYFVHISDTHIGPRPGYARHGHISLTCAQRLVDIINTLPIEVDFVVHTGDIVTDPHPDAYALAAETLASLKLPVYYVPGNHDAVADVRRYLPLPPHTPLTAEPDRLCYAFERKGYRFLVLDAHTTPELDPQGDLTAPQLEAMQREATPDGPPLVVFIHYPVLRMNATWMDANMLVRNGEELHQALLPARDRLRGVFSGHVHQSMQTLREGIVYTAVASTFSQFTAWPGEETVGYAADAPPAYNVVHLLPDQTIVHQHTFPRP